MRFKNYVERDQLLAERTLKRNEVSENGRCYKMVKIERLPVYMLWGSGQLGTAGAQPCLAALVSATRVGVGEVNEARASDIRGVVAVCEAV